MSRSGKVLDSTSELLLQIFGFPSFKIPASRSAFVKFDYKRIIDHISA